MPRLTALHRFPVKSCGGERLDTAVVQPWGLDGDRRWMLVDETGETVTARERPRMLLIHARARDGGGLVATAKDPDDADDADNAGDAGDAGELVVDVPRPSEPTPVSVFGRTAFDAAPAEAAAHAWFSDRLGAPVRLVYAEDPHRRPANPAFAPEGTPMAFQDGYPLLVTTEASLAVLNELIAAGDRWAEGPLPMVRFRPNLVVAGTEAWAEDGWRRIRVGAATFLAVKGCDRCAIPTTDHRTAARFKEPTATLARHRRWDGAVWFGMNLVPETPGAVLKVGDEVEILEAVPAPDGPPR